MGDEIIHGPRECRGIINRCDQRVVPVLQQLQGTLVGGADNSFASGHGFQDNIAQRFMARRTEENVRRRMEGGDVGAPAQKIDAVEYSELRRLILLWDGCVAASVAPALRTIRR